MQDDLTPDFEWKAPYAVGSEEMVDAPLTHPLTVLQEKGLAQDWSKPAALNERGGPLPPQWINCDLKSFDVSLLGKWDLIVADPPWDIHMALPYGTMSDDDMRAMPIPQLQDEGLIFLWVTGRAMELGRELLSIWGYTRVDELIWVKVGQTQRLIRTGRTGHWLNHTKEHCLVGAKVRKEGGQGSRIAANHPGQPIAGVLPDWIKRGLSTDVIVSEVRDTSRKPDELYGMIEKLCPGGRKLELFGRRQNCRPGWLTLGNQLKSDNLIDPELKEKVEQARADGLPGLLPPS